MMLGKRKRNTTAVSRRIRDSPAPDNEESTVLNSDQDVFRQYFEAKFEPLPDLALSTQSLHKAENELQGEDASDSSEWDGFLDEDESVQMIELIEYGRISRPDGASHVSAEVKEFMSSRPTTGSTRLPLLGSTKEAKEDTAEADNLKNDLDLQRLLGESVLLKNSKEAAMFNSHRHRTTDMRLQSLGFTSSLYSQEKMPMAHRRGIQAKAQAREGSRRLTANENGIILEKASKTNKAPKVRRERGVDAPGIGQFRNGSLNLSRKDLDEIQGSQPRARTGRGRSRR